MVYLRPLICSPLKEVQTCRYSPDKIRNVAVVGHNDTGKTTLVSALLYAGGVTTRLHRVEDGNTLTDFDHEEIERKHLDRPRRLFRPLAEHKINLLDCPGYGIFFIETQQGLRAADSVAPLRQRRRRRRGQHREGLEASPPRSSCRVMVNSPRWTASGPTSTAPSRAAEEVRQSVVPIQIPIGQEAGFTGVVDLVAMKA